MRSFFVRCLSLAVLLSAMTISINVYSQKTKKDKQLPHAINKDLLVAKWTAGNEEYSFENDGTSIVKVEGRMCPGTWELKGRTLTLNPKKLMWKKGDLCSKTHILQVVSVSKNELHMMVTDENKELRLTKQK